MSWIGLHPRVPEQSNRKLGIRPPTARNSMLPATWKSLPRTWCLWRASVRPRSYWRSRSRCRFDFSAEPIVSDKLSSFGEAFGNTSPANGTRGTFAGAVAFKYQVSPHFNHSSAQATIPTTYSTSVRASTSIFRNDLPIRMGPAPPTDAQLGPGPPWNTPP